MVIGILFLFNTIGVLSIYLAWKENWFMVFFGFFLVGFTLFACYLSIFWAIPDSYNTLIVKKYGVNIDAKVINKCIEDYSCQEKINGSNSYEKIEEFHYCIEFEYTYLKTYRDSFYLYNIELYHKVNKGSIIPIRVLKTAPKKAKARIVKMGIDLGFKRKDCK